MTMEDEIGTRIATARRQAGLTQADLAAELSVTAQAVGKWERGESMPDILTFGRLASSLGVDMNYFLGMQTIDQQPEAAPGAEQPLKTPLKAAEGVLQRDMSMGNWVDANFSRLKNLGKRFSGSNIQHSRFVDSDLSGLELKGNNIQGSDFSKSDLSGATFSGANLDGDDFSDCAFTGAVFDSCAIKDCDLSRADLTRAEFAKSAILRCEFGTVDWSHISFRKCSLDTMTLRGTFTDCVFDNCGSTRLVFEDATFIDCFVKNGKMMKKATFVNCYADQISYAFLQSAQADLSGIELVES
jgi:uncharacterized protein YjbI with pentapeptide repeats/DNA-binding XRE family transcriptional regulator